MKRHRLLGLLVLLSLAGCAMLSNTPPMLGRIENGIYHHPKGTFSCPIPDAEQGFSGEVQIEDAWVEKRVEPRPPHELKPGDWNRYRTIYLGTRALPGATFSDSMDNANKILIEPRVMPTRSDSILTSHFHGSFSTALHEAIIDSRHGRMGYAVLQVPYFDPQAHYMNVNLLQAHLRGDAPPPTIVVMVNLIKDQVHHHMRLERSSLPFLPAGINWRDLPAVRAALETNSELVPLMQEQTLTYLERCRFSGASLQGESG